MKLALATVLALLCGSHRTSLVHALAGGAAGCGAPGVPAVGDPQHFDATDLVSGGALSEKGVVVTIGGVEVVDGLVLPVNVDLPWTVTANGAPMRGVLFRAEVVDGPDTIVMLDTTSDLLQPTAMGVCIDPVQGITHNTNVDKTEAVGTINLMTALDEVSSVAVDVTVVFVNNATISDFAHTGYAVQFAGAAATPGPTGPTAAPSTSATGTGGPTTSPAPTTSSPTYSEECFLCGDPNLFVDPTLSFFLEGEEILCSDAELAAQNFLVSPEECVVGTELVLANCNCQPAVDRSNTTMPVVTETTPPAPTAMPSNATRETLAPTAMPSMMNITTEMPTMNMTTEMPTMMNMTNTTMNETDAPRATMEPVAPPTESPVVAPVAPAPTSGAFGSTASAVSVLLLAVSSIFFYF